MRICAKGIRRRAARPGKIDIWRPEQRQDYNDRSCEHFEPSRAPLCKSRQDERNSQTHEDRHKGRRGINARPEQSAGRVRRSAVHGFFNGNKLFDVENKTFADAGSVGVWIGDAL